MKKSDIFLNSLIYAAYMLFSCIVIMFAEMLLIKVVNVLIEVKPLTLCIIRAIVYTVGVNSLLAIVSFKEGYRAGYFSAPGTLVSCAAATLLHFVFSLLFSFEAFASGGVKFVYALAAFGARLNSPSFTDRLDRIDVIPYFFLNAVVYIAVIVIFGKIGERKRLSDRKELTGSDKNNA